MPSSRATFRRLQRLGGGSLFLSLPRSWITERGLEKGSLVSIEQAADGSLIIKGGAIKPPLTHITARIDATKLTPDELVAQLNGAYVAGADIVNVVVYGAPDFNLRTRVRSIAKELLGLELADEGESSMTFRFMLDVTAMKPDHIIRRMSSLSSTMYVEALEYESETQKNGSEGLEQKKSDLRRLHLLGARILAQCAENPVLSAELGVPSKFVAEYIHVLYVLRRIGEIGFDIRDISAGKRNIVDKEVKTYANSLQVLQDCALQSFLSSGLRADDVLNKGTTHMTQIEASVMKENTSVEACLLREVNRSLIEIAESAMRLKSWNQ